MRIRPTIVCLLAATVAHAAPATPAPGGEHDPSPVRLANHRAVYDLSLAKSSGTRAIEGARGRIVVDFAGDACKGYTMQTRQVTILSSGESGDRSSDLRSTTFEGGDGRTLRFRNETILNGRGGQLVDGTADSAADALKVRLKEPKRDGFTAEGPVLFPTRHMRRLIEAARAGETTLAAKVFDGSDDGRKVYDTLAVIGRASATPAAAGDPSGQGSAQDRDKPLREGEMAAMRRWPVTLSYYTEGAGERTPIYTLGFDLYENGVSGALRLDYGDFAIDGTMTRFDLAKADPKAEGECGK